LELSFCSTEIEAEAENDDLHNYCKYHSLRRHGDENYMVLSFEGAVWPASGNFETQSTRVGRARPGVFRMRVIWAGASG
jgi:hypothetical protein